MALSLDRQNQLREQYRRLRPGWQPATEVYEATIRQYFRPETRVLDLGCGRGGVLEQLGELVEHPFGFDPDLLSLREHRLPTLPRAQSLADRLPLRDECIDLIVCSWVFEHLTDPVAVFRELHRVLTRDGKVIFLTPNSASLVARINHLLRPVQRLLVERLYGRAEADTFPIAYQINTQAAIMRTAERVGLHCDLLRGIDDPTYLAFHPLLFRLSVVVSRLTPPVQWVGVLSK
ncbi:MAG: class I SAM-dependent methyltransferase [Anaerolineae bacterium]|nr:class I SAM-dependent methyltransferase [Anaerolineae bacterium]